jgi:hypothetical protein
MVAGIVYLDLDASRTPGPADQPLAGVQLRLLVSGTGDTAASAVSEPDGAFTFGLVPAGRYTVTVPSGQFFGDSISVVRVDTSAINLHARDSVGVNVAVSYPKVGIAEARALPLGTKVFIDGVALNFRDLFGDTVVHVQDTSSAIRVTAVQGPVTAGDSVRVLGRVAARDGQPVIERGEVMVLAIVTQPVAEVVTTGQAATADGGRLDAALVRVVSATIADTTTNGDGDYVVTVDDGSGSLLVVFDQDAALDASPFVPGVSIDARGVLVPDGVGGWRLKPRSTGPASPDVVVVP